MLRYRQPIPDEILLHNISVSIFPEVPHQMPFQLPILAIQAAQAGLELVAGVGEPPECKIRTEA
jgi:hypothetical protein